jgi:beta-1,2-mannobiose phosphorylase / 1,2-beta-oligomannan phosphorylase
MTEWIKHPGNPVLGPGICTQAVYDCCVIPEGDRLRMWFSWRDLRSIAYCESRDGVHWTAPRTCLEPDATIAWEKDDVHRPHVLQVGDTWYLWYSAENRETDRTQIGLATSRDGVHWERNGNEPVLSPGGGWEKANVMCPHVVFENGIFKMWYSGGEMYEPDAIGYAESDDGIHWRREATNPVIRPQGGWERDRTTAACIVRREKDYLAFYIGMANGYENCRIGMARSADGIHGWERYPGNPILGLGPAGSWDDCNVYKPYAALFGGRWYLWYNASRNSDRREQIGLATATSIDF